MSWGFYRRKGRQPSIGVRSSKFYGSLVPLHDSAAILRDMSQRNVDCRYTLHISCNFKIVEETRTSSELKFLSPTLQLSHIPQPFSYFLIRRPCEDGYGCEYFKGEAGEEFWSRAAESVTFKETSALFQTCTVIGAIGLQN